MTLYKRFLKKIAHIQVEHPIATVLIVLAITLIFMGGASQVRTVAALEQMMPSDLNEIKAFNTLRDAGVGQDMVAVVIQLNPESTIVRSDILEWDVYQHVKLVTDTLKEEQDILEVYSLSTLLEQFNNGTVNETTFNKFVKDEAMKNYLLNYANRARTNTLVIATTDVSAHDARMNLLAQRIITTMESAGSPPGLTYKLTGTPVIQQELGKLIAHDRQVTKNLSTLFVFLIVMLIFGTVTSAVVPIAVVTISVTWLYGTMGYTGLPISTLAGGVAAMVIGIGIDYAIHLMNRFKYERKQGHEVKEAIESAVSDTGVATTGAAITTMLAFIAFLTGAMPEMHRFGLLMTIGVAYSFLLTITALPAMLVLEERLFFKLRKHLHFGVEGEYFLATKEETCPPGYTPLQGDDHEVYKELRNRFSVYKHGKKEKTRRGDK
jgi:predicted RND superfamily exporter protein